jgi:PAS domain S-box-containing protein
VTAKDPEQELLQSVALQNATSILRARRRAEQELFEAKEALSRSNERIQRILGSITDGFIALDPSWRFTYANAVAQRLLGGVDTPGKSLLGREIWTEFPGLVGTDIERACRQALADQETVELETFYTPLSSWFDICVYPLQDGLSIYFQDVTRRKDAEGRLSAERRVLELIATGAPLGDVLDRVAREAEAQSVEGLLCSVLLLDEAGEHLLHGAAPTLPQAYNDAIHGVRIGPRVGSCGTAAFERRAVAVSDIATDPLWEDFKALAATHGLRACTSTPIFSSQGDLLGTIAAYYHSSRRPSPADEQIITMAVRLAGIAIERKRSEEVLRVREDRLRVTFEQAAVGIAMAGLDGYFVEMNRKFCELVGYSVAELRQRTFRDLTHPDDKATTDASIGRLKSGEIRDYSLEKRYVRRDGVAFWSLTTVTLLHDSAGQAERFIGVIEDISGRKEAERKLQESEEQLRQLADSIPQLAWMARPDGEIFWYNQRFYAYTGATLEHMTGAGWRSVHDSSLLPDIMAHWRASVASGTPFEMEYPLRAADGSSRWFLTRVNPMRDESGAVVRWFGTSTDIDQVKRIRQELEAESRVLELLNRTGTLLASTLDPQALLQSITDSATQLSGAEFGAFFYNLVNEQGEAYMLYTLSGAPREAFENFGQPRATAIFAPTFRGEGVIRCDDVRADPRYGQMAPHHGMPAGHLPVRSYLAVPVVSRSGDVIGGLFFGHSKTGVFSERTERLISGVAAQAGVAIDNARLYETAQKAAQEREQLLESERHARTAAEQASHMKDDFLATLSHELRTPLSAILGWSHLLRAKTTSPEHLAKGLEVIERNARMQTQLIEDLLDMSRITSGKVRLDVQSVLVASCVDAAFETVRPAAEAKGIRLEKMLDPVAGPVSGDPSRLQQVIWNLLNNAIKFTPKDGKVQAVVQRVNSHIEISVADTGAGIEPHLLLHIFERFRQADASTTRQFGGLGLGLAIVKHLVELHGGTVRAHSAGLGQGSTFTVQLPLVVMQRAADMEPRQHPRTPEVALRDFESVDLTGVKVLVVDDQADARELIERLLTQCNAQVVTASNAHEAVILVEQERPHVLLSDIGMPDVDGFELLKRVRALGAERGGNLAAIALTAFARSEDRTRALNHGFRVHVAKPVEPSELIATVASVAGRTGPR